MATSHVPELEEKISETNAGDDNDGSKEKCEYIA